MVEALEVKRRLLFEINGGFDELVQKSENRSCKYFLTKIRLLFFHHLNLDFYLFQRRFIVPTNRDFDKIPFSRVNHNKYMVTDIAAYIGTSNWSGDYFVNTGGT